MLDKDFDIRPPVLVGDTADVHLQRSLAILRNEGVNPTVSMEFYPRRTGLLCGMKEVCALLRKVLPETGSEVWALEEGEVVESGEVALRVRAPYGTFGLYETAICGALSSYSGWADAARECVEAARETPVFALPVGYVHPNIAANIEYASVVGGCVSCATVLGARLSGITPMGFMPHALPLLLGDTVKATQSFDRYMPQEVPRIAVVDTFRDEVEEALNVAGALGEQLRGILLATAAERGGVTPDLVKECRARLDQDGFRHVEIYVTGGITAERIREFIEAEAPVNGFGVGSCISSASPNDFTANIQELDGKPVAKRGRVPGVTTNPRLDRVI